MDKGFAKLPGWYPYHWCDQIGKKRNHSLLDFKQGRFNILHITGFHGSGDEMKQQLEGT